MNDLSQIQRDLPDVNNIGLSATKCFDGDDYGLLSICVWSQDLTPDSDIALTIVDETDHLEWTIMIRSVLDIRPSPESFRVKIPRSSVSHRLVVTVQVLRKILSIDTVTSDFERRKITAVCSREAMFVVRANAVPSLFPVLDVRPQLREGVGVSDDAGRMIIFLDPGTILPAASLPLPIKCAGENTVFDLYQGNSTAASQNRKLDSVALPKLSDDLEKNCTLTLNVDDDGTLRQTFAAVNSLNICEETIAHSIVDVICPKIAIDTRDPYELRVERMMTVDKVVLTFTTSYEEIYCWRVSFAVDEAVTGNWKYVFLYLGDGSHQRFEVPSSIFEVGLRYIVTVEGLKLIDGRFDDWCGNFRTAYFRTVCKNYVLLDTLQLPVSQDDDDLEIEIQRSTFQRASVRITTSLQRANQMLKLTIQNTECFYKPRQEISDFPMQLQPGHRYQVMVELTGDKSVRRSATFRAELTIEDITTLYRIASGHAADQGSFPCQCLYRNKSKEYFQNILKNRGGIMEVRNKDNSGDPASPINLQIKGLFFMSSVYKKPGQLPTLSPFGPTRVCISADDELRKVVEKTFRLYFVDYYCMTGKPHYVTLVITKSDSEIDKFCSKRLLPLSVDGSSGNPFLFYQDGQLNVSAATDLWVELFYTENIDIRGCGLQHNIPIFGTGSSKPEGIPKRRNCARCDLNLIYTQAPNP